MGDGRGARPGFLPPALPPLPLVFLPGIVDAAADGGGGGGEGEITD